jgi:hypothetical protein
MADYVPVPGFEAPPTDAPPGAPDPGLFMQDPRQAFAAHALTRYGVEPPPLQMPKPGFLDALQLGVAGMGDAAGYLDAIKRGRSPGTPGAMTAITAKGIQDRQAAGYEAQIKQREAWQKERQAVGDIYKTYVDLWDKGVDRDLSALAKVAENPAVTPDQLEVAVQKAIARAPLMEPIYRGVIARPDVRPWVSDLLPVFNESEQGRELAGQLMGAMSVAKTAQEREGLLETARVHAANLMNADATMLVLGYARQYGSMGEDKKATSFEDFRDFYTAATGKRAEAFDRYFTGTLTKNDDQKAKVNALLSRANIELPDAKALAATEEAKEAGKQAAYPAVDTRGAEAKILQKWGYDPKTFKPHANPGNQAVWGQVQAQLKKDAAEQAGKETLARQEAETTEALTPPAQQKKELDAQRAIRVAAATGAGAVDRQMAQPAGPDDMAKYVDPEALRRGELRSPPPGSTVGDLRKTYPTMTDDEKVQFRAQGGVLRLIDGLDQNASKVITARTPEEARSQGFRETINAFLKQNPDAVVYDASSRAARDPIARGLFAQKGATTDRDADRVAAAMPTFFDTAEIRQRKFAFMRDIAQHSRAMLIAEKTGADTVAPRNRIEDAIAAMEKLTPPTPEEARRALKARQGK